MSTKKCPFCAEQIQLEAVKCKHCGSMIGDGAPAAPAAPPERSEALGTLALSLPFFATGLVWFWVGEQNLLQNPSSNLFTIAVVVVVGSAVLIGLEAQSVGAGGEQDLASDGLRRTSAGAWGGVTLFVWVVGFLGWLHRRSTYGLRNLLFPGVMFVLLFGGSWVWMFDAIESRKEAIRRTLSGLDSAASPEPPRPKLTLAEKTCGPRPELATRWMGAPSLTDGYVAGQQLTRVSADLEVPAKLRQEQLSSIACHAALETAERAKPVFPRKVGAVVVRLFTKDTPSFITPDAGTVTFSSNGKGSLLDVDPSVPMDEWRMNVSIAHGYLDASAR